MYVYKYDIWDGDKGIIFAESEEEAEKMFMKNYPDTEMADDGYDSGTCVIDYIGKVPNKPKLFFVEG